MTKLNTKIKVLIVDDSAIVRKILSTELGAIHDIEIAGTAPDPFVARDKILTLQPDVVTLDVEMPRMDGITFLKKLMAHHPIPVIILSSLTPKGGKTAMEALSAGAIDVICKPGESYSVGDTCKILADKIRIASRAKLKANSQVLKSAPRTTHMAETTNKILAIGSSTGGVQALGKVFSTMPVNCPGTVVVQHMPAAFTSSFANRLNDECAVNIKEAEDGDRVVPGRILIAPGGMHMLFRRSGANYYVSIKDGPAVCRQKPSVEVLFNSVAKYAGANAVGAILTGMGNDGAAGLLNMRNAGAHTLAQDEESCVVFGMPKEAIEKGGAEKIVPLNKVTETLIAFAQQRATVSV